MDIQKRRVWVSRMKKRSEEKEIHIKLDSSLIERIRDLGYSITDYVALASSVCLENDIIPPKNELHRTLFLKRSHEKVVAPRRGFEPRTLRSAASRPIQTRPPGHPRNFWRKPYKICLQYH